MSRRFIINVTWTEEMIADLKQALSEGKSGTQAAAILSAKYKHNFTRNSIIGKANRMQIEIKKPPKSKKTKANEKTKNVILKPKKIAVVPKPPQVIEAPIKEGPFMNPLSNPTTLLDLQENQCRYPTGDPKDGTLVFCGAPADSPMHRSYCTYCYSIAYYPLHKHVRQKFKAVAIK